jgi:exodeoxyribonuclease VII large subunit
MYFTLKDEKSEIRCVMFKGPNQLLHFKPENGMQILLEGEISVYEPRGQYQILVKKMEPAGIGTLYLAFEALKKQLSIEGLFDLDKKQKLPTYPRNIGIITSKTGAAVQDIFQVLHRRAPHVNIILRSTQVQGDKAANDIVEAINDMVSYNKLDVIIIGRGGGSLEDLWPFNEEPVARAIFSCPIPIISAVGHETDLSISDLVADMRAPTPSAAAELVSPATNDIFETIIGFERNLFSLMKRYLQIHWQTLDNTKDRFALQEPSRLLQKHNDRHNELTKLLFQTYRYSIQTFSSKFSTLHEKLHALNPKNILSRGYSIAYREDDQKIILDPRDLQQQEHFKLQTYKGTLRAKKTGEKK